MSLPVTRPSTGVSSSVLMLDGVAVGASFTGLTVMLTTVSVTPPLPSLTVTTKLSLPL